MPIGKSISDAIDNALIDVEKQGKEISDSARLLSDKLSEKLLESAELDADKLTKRQTQMLESMEVGVPYSTEDIAVKVGFKGPRTTQLLNELVAMGILECTAATKNRRYIRK